MNPIKEYLLSDGRKLSIFYDEDMESPRDWDNTWRMCISPHRNYSFPNELCRNFDNRLDRTWDHLPRWSVMDKKGWCWSEHDINSYDRELENISRYYIFPLSCYEHSGISFSIMGTLAQCQFDTSRWIGFIAVPKQQNDYDWREWNSSNVQEKWNKILYTEEEALKIAENEIAVYNKYLNGEWYRYVEYKKDIWTNSKWESKEEREGTWDSCSWYYDIKDILDEFQSLDPKKI